MAVSIVMPISMPKVLQHNPESPLLIGELSPTDKITERKMKSLRGKVLNQEQLSLF